MRIHAIRKQLWLAGSLLWIGTVIVLTWGWLDSQNTVATTVITTKSKPHTHQNNTQQETPPIPDLNKFSDVWALRMQRPLYDPPPKKPPPPPPKPKPKPLKVRLLGTMLESDRPTAMFAVPGEGICIREVGQTINNQPGNATIIKIEADRVVLEYAGAQRVLTLNAKK